ncbi:MAG: hypothetical protein R6V04_00420 [bacterium]
MKKILIVFIVLVFTAALKATDEETLFSGDVSHGGFGGPVVTFSSINNNTGVMVGGRGGWIINHMITIGGAGYGLVTRIPTLQSTAGNDSLSLGLGYGGFEIGFIMNSWKLTHLSFFFLIGGGGASHILWDEEDFDMDNDGDAFFVLEPGIEAVLNVTKFFRISAGASYRYTSGLELEQITDSDISGLAAKISLKFGSF